MYLSIRACMSWAQASAQCRGKITIGDRTGILLCLDEGTGCTHLNYEESYIVKREERETARRLGEKYKSFSPQYCYHHKRHFLWEIPLTSTEWHCLPILCQLSLSELIGCLVITKIWYLSAGWDVEYLNNPGMGYPLGCLNGWISLFAPLPHS